MMKKLNIGNFEFGLIGSIVFAGLATGSAFATYIYSFSDWIKTTLATTVIINGLCLFFF
jgi:hypothetical protein